MTQERQNQMYEQLCELTGEDVVRAFTHYHGMQLLDDGFLQHLKEEGYIFYDDGDEIDIE